MGPRSGIRKIFSGKLETHYERQCLGSFPNTTRFGTSPYFKDDCSSQKCVRDNGQYFEKL